MIGSKIKQIFQKCINVFVFDLQLIILIVILLNKRNTFKIQDELQTRLLDFTTTGDFKNVT